MDFARTSCLMGAVIEASSPCGPPRSWSLTTCCCQGICGRAFLAPAPPRSRGSEGKKMLLPVYSSQGSLSTHHGVNCKQQQGAVREVIPPGALELVARQAILQCTHAPQKGKCFPASACVLLSFTQRRQSLLSQEGEQCKLMFNARFTHVSIRH